MDFNSARSLCLGALVILPLASGLVLTSLAIKRTNHWPYSRKTLLKNALACLFKNAKIAIFPSNGVLTLESGKAGRIALIQFNGDIAMGQTGSNLEQLLGLAEQAVAGGAKVIVLPEGGIHGYGDPTRGYWCADASRLVNIRGKDVQSRDVKEVAEPLPGGKSELTWSRFARENDVVVIFDLIERQDELFFNTLAVCDATGLISRHRKVHLMPEEQFYATPGSGPTVISTAIGRFGLMICNDSWLGVDLFRNYLARSVDGLIVSSYWNSLRPGDVQRTAKRHFALIALEHQLHVFVADNSYSDGTGHYKPCSLLGPERHGLALPAPNINGVSLHDISWYGTKAPSL